MDERDEEGLEALESDVARPTTAVRSLKECVRLATVDNFQGARILKLQPHFVSLNCACRRGE